MSSVFFSLLASVIIQIITGIFEFYALFIYVPIQFILIKQLLILELIVQFIEGTFYVYWLYNFNNIFNITPNRYFDWVITTPTMLITLIFYIIFLNYRENNIDTKLDFFTLFYDNFFTLIIVLLLNWTMLLFGYLGEIKILPLFTAISLGFIPFFIYFFIIYTQYTTFTFNGHTIYFYFLFFWTLYGIAALLPYNIKNTFYNILDLFAKNFFGIFLSFIIFTHQF